MVDISFVDHEVYPEVSSKQEWGKVELKHGVQSICAINSHKTVLQIPSRTNKPELE